MFALVTLLLSLAFGLYLTYSGIGLLKNKGGTLVGRGSLPVSGKFAQILGIVLIIVGIYFLLGFFQLLTNTLQVMV